MAATTLNPYVCDAPGIQDPVTFKEAALLFRETEHRVAASTFTRWAKEDGLDTGRRGKALVVSFSDLLEAYTRRYPAPTKP